jgi:hypothetical protein
MALYFELLKQHASSAYQILLCLTHWKIGVEAMRECIRHFWIYDSRLLRSSPAFTTENARKLLREARFAIPEHLPQTSQIWRGASGQTVEEAAKGLSWTLSFEAACWFATQREDRDAGEAIVITAYVDRSNILFVDPIDAYDEQEIIPDRVDKAVLAEGTPEEWAERGQLFAKARKP